ncbi:MAG: hypothetical protein VKO39_03445 [Cyanobacteriota bacterium]|nr:hypothetical protein [Cyanobacteriota bacterium]
MTIDELIAKVREHLDGIDRTQDDSRGGFWQTEDGAKAGRILLRNLEQMLRDNWPDHAPAPSNNEVSELSRELESHARHITELEAEGFPADNDLAALLLRAAELLRQSSATPEPPIPPDWIPTRYFTGGWARIERTTLPPWPERWAVRAGGKCLTTAGNWVHEDHSSERPEGRLALHRFPTPQAAWEALQRFPTPQAAWEALQLSRGVQA